MKISLSLLLRILSFLSKYHYDDDDMPSSPGNTGHALHSELMQEMCKEAK